MGSGEVTSSMTESAGFVRIKKKKKIGATEREAGNAEVR